MGQRANLVIVEGGQQTVYYDHWCANRLDDELFWGPDESLRFIRQRDPIEDAWLDDVWCEGAVVVDADRHVMLFFGGEDVLYDARLRRIHLDLLRRQWDGWDVRWASEGLMSIADYLGIARETFAADRARGPQPFIVPPPASEASSVVLTEMLPNGRLRLARIRGNATNLLCGPQSLESTLRQARFQDRLEWIEDFPHGGVHVDRAARRLETWWSDETSDTRRKVETIWNGWNVRWDFDDYDPHFALCGDALTLQPFDVRVAQQNILDRLEKSLVDALPRNPARDLADIGREVKISPWTDHSRGRSRSTDKRAMLDALRRELS